MGRRLFVGNLNFATTSDDLKELFAEAGPCDSAEVMIDRATGRSRGFAFVEMGSDEAAVKAVEEMNGRSFQGRTAQGERSPRAHPGWWGWRPARRPSAALVLAPSVVRLQRLRRRWRLRRRLWGRIRWRRLRRRWWGGVATRAEVGAAGASSPVRKAAAAAACEPEAQPMTSPQPALSSGAAAREAGADLDLPFARSQFPALARGEIFLDNAGGSLVLAGVADRVRDYLLSTSVQLGATYAPPARRQSGWPRGPGRRRALVTPPIRPRSSSAPRAPRCCRGSPGRWRGISAPATRSS